ncbi:MAG TPA: hypothetical protein ENG95_02730 [Nitrospirae bacterium]|nr:hypothetical protein [Nitrospirota bacterium]
MVDSAKKDIIFILLYCAYALLTVPVFWERNAVTGLLLIINYINPSVIHLPGSLTVNTLPWWLFFAWGYIVLLFVHVAYAIEKIMNVSFSDRFRLLQRLGTLLIWIIIVTYFGFVFAALNIKLTRWFLIIIIPFVLFWRRNIDVIAFFAGALLGTFGEWVCMHSGTWVYTLPYFKKAGIPLSLPLAWGLVTVLLRRFSLLFDFKRSKA